MNSQRYDIYRLIHKGMRAFLTDTLLTIGRMDVASPDLQHGLGKLNGLLNFCMSHLEHENEFIHPAMNARQPGSADNMYEHHDHHIQLIRELLNLSQELEQGSPTDKEQVAAKLYRKLALFVADNLAHMHEEETENNAVLWQHYSDAEIQAIEQALVASISPQQNAEVMYWMLPAINHGERQEFLLGMREHAPALVFQGVMDIARQHLKRDDWSKLQFALVG